MKKDSLKVSFALAAGLLYNGMQSLQDHIVKRSVSFPADRFVQFYGASFAGALSFSMITNCTLFKKRPALSAAFSAAVLTGWELLTAMAPRRSFDWGDMAVYAVALPLAYKVSEYCNRPDTDEKSPAPTP